MLVQNINCEIVLESSPPLHFHGLTADFLTSEPDYGGTLSLPRATPLPILSAELVPPYSCWLNTPWGFHCLQGKVQAPQVQARTFLIICRPMLQSYPSLLHPATQYKSYAEQFALLSAQQISLFVDTYYLQSSVQRTLLYMYHLI